MSSLSLSLFCLSLSHTLSYTGVSPTRTNVSLSLSLKAEPSGLLTRRRGQDELVAFQAVSTMGESGGDVELTNMTTMPKEGSKVRPKRRRRRCLACCGACTVLLVIIIVVLVILAFTVFKPKNPTLHVDSITLENFNAQIEFNIPPSLKLNVTLGLVLSIKNRNKVGFNFYNSTAYMFYRDREVGVTPIPSGKVGAGKTVQVSTSLLLFADRLLRDVQVYADFLAGSLPFTTKSDISGRVTILNIFKRHVDTSAVCNTTISIANPTQNIDNVQCQYAIHI